MKIVVVSDNHGKRRELEDIRRKYDHFDAFIHCGDSEMTQDELRGWVSVRGNNDYYVDLPDATVVKVKDYNILVTHSHLVSYFRRTERLVEMAQANQCQMVCFGHTHVFVDEVVEGIQLVNPGSIWYNRDRSNPCYALVEINDDDYRQVKVTRVDI